MATRVPGLGYSIILSGAMTLTLYLVSRSQGLPWFVWILTFIVFLACALLWQKLGATMSDTTSSPRFRVPLFAASGAFGCLMLGALFYVILT